MKDSGNVKESDMNVPLRLPVQETESASNSGHNQDKTLAKKDEAMTSKYESFCKLIAVAIVVISFVFHLLRGAREGMFFTHD